MEIEKSYTDASRNYIDYLSSAASLRNIDAESSEFDIDRSVLDINNLRLLNDYRYENYLDDFYITATQLIDAYKEVKEEIEMILVLSSVDDEPGTKH